jgi:hypothetical protein
LLAELRAHERQAAEELCQWKVAFDERKVADATPRAIELALVMSAPELLALRAKLLALHEGAERVPLPIAK